MNTQELLQSMNELLRQGLKVSEAEKQLGYSDGQARKQLSKEGFKCDRKLNQYILKSKNVTGSDGMLQENKRTPKQVPKVTCSNSVLSEQKANSEVIQKQVFTMEQVDILYRIIEEYQVRQQIQTEASEDRGKTINRNVRVYKAQFEAFAEWCKVNNVTQADALYKAIDLLINNKCN